MLGIDISKWNINIKWQALKDNGVSFAIIKATQNVFKDRMMDEHAKACNMPFGFYHWLDLSVAQEPQANAFINATANYNYAFLAVDVEQYWASWDEYYRDDIQTIIPPEKILSRTKNFINLLKGMTAKPIVIYSAYWFMQYYCKALEDYMTDFPCWWVDQKGYRNLGLPVDTTLDAVMTHLPKDFTLPANYPSWKFWQFCADSNKIPEINGSVDFNLFNGNENDFARLFNLDEEAPKPLTLDERVKRLEEMHGL